MPRISAEARAAAALRAGARRREPPSTLSPQARAEWAQIVNSKPVDWFDAGSFILLERFCEGAVHARALEKRLSTLRRAGAWSELKEWEKRYAKLAAALTGLATKLRLSVQAAVERHSRMLDERADAKTEEDRLIGGTAVWGETRGKLAN